MTDDHKAVVSILNLMLAATIMDPRNRKSIQDAAAAIESLSEQLERAEAELARLEAAYLENERTMWIHYSERKKAEGELAELRKEREHADR